MKYKNLLVALLFLLLAAACANKQDDEKEIRQILDSQITNWNKGNLDDFMKGYWENDSLMFIGSSGVTYGYGNTLNNYKRSYSDTAKMGKLEFDILQVKRVSDDAYFVVGKWFLKRTVGDVGGHYTLLFRKINGKWVIVADHSS